MRLRQEPLWSLDDTMAVTRQMPAAASLAQSVEKSPAALASSSLTPQITAVAQSLAEIGITERDEALLQTVAERLTELG